MSNKEVKICSIFAILFLTAGFFVLPKSVRAEEKITINEIMYNFDDNVDWIELKSNSAIILWYYGNKEKSGWKIKNLKINDGDDDTKHNVYVEKEEVVGIKEKEYFIVTNDVEKFKEKYKYIDEIVVLKSSINLTKPKKDRKITIFSEDNNEDEFIYNGGLGAKNNKTIERDEDDGIWKESNVSYGTPGRKNFREDDRFKDELKPKKYSHKIRINEILPKPKSGEKEFIEIYNPEKDDLGGLKVKDKSGRECEFPKGIPEKEFTVLWDCGIKLNDTTEENLTLYNPVNPGEQISYVEYKKSGGENVSYNFDGTYWRWSRFLTPDKENQFNNLPTSKIKIEKKVYENMLAEFRVSAKDKDRDRLKFIWDFGDGHKSYLKNIKHKYEKKGIYTVILKISDGSEDILETFEIKVGKFPKSELKIVGVKANPKGKDADLETVKIKNSSKKKVNLQNWSIATGWKNLYNHPINKKLVLKPGETREITRKYSLFSLNNKQAKIELCRPDGSIASKVKYSKKEGIQDDEIYEKTKNDWEWIRSQTSADNTQNDTDLTQSSADNSKNMQNNTEEKLTAEENQDNQEIINAEIQSDELAENGEVLGIETNRNIENINNKPKSGNFIQRIIWNANQLVNNFINFFL